MKLKIQGVLAERLQMIRKKASAFFASSHWDWQNAFDSLKHRQP